MKWAFFGSSLVSAYWNGAATYYRGIIRALSRRGHQITFFEPDAYGRQQNRDIDVPNWAEVFVYQPNLDGMQRALQLAREADVLVKASGVGVLDSELEAEIADMKRPGNITVFWDVDPATTLERVEINLHDPFRERIPQFDLILTYCGGEAVQHRYQTLRAKQCQAVFTALDPSTHHPVASDSKFRGTLGFLGNRLPDRQKRVEEFFLKAAREFTRDTFVLGGSGWAGIKLPRNLKHLGHLYTHQHNAFNSSLKAVLNLSRSNVSRWGYAPAPRVFEAAGAGACVISDSWQGIEHFFEPGKEILVAHDGKDVLEHLAGLSTERAKRIGAAAYRRVLAEHTYDRRASEVDSLLRTGVARQSA